MIERRPSLGCCYFVACHEKWSLRAVLATVAGEVEHIRASEINGTPAVAEADYKIVMLTDSERRIRMDPQGYEFVGHRVLKFDFPECPNGA